MQATDPKASSPAFLQPQNGNSHKSSGYVPGRIVVPFRPPPPPKSQASAKFTSARQEARATVGSSDEQRHQAEASRKKRHKNTLICFAISSFSFFVALAVILGIASKYAPDGELLSYSCCSL